MIALSHQDFPDAFRYRSYLVRIKIWFDFYPNYSRSIADQCERMMIAGVTVLEVDAVAAPYFEFSGFTITQGTYAARTVGSFLPRVEGS